MKISQIIIFGLLASIAALSIEILVPITGDISLAMRVSAQQGTQIISVFLLGMAFGEYLAGPVSDVYGR